MNIHNKNILRDTITLHRSNLSNRGIRPNPAAIAAKAQKIKNFIENGGVDEGGLIALVAPDPGLTRIFFRGWRIADFNSLITEISNL